MKILLTGASSFTGYWFAKSLAEAGHEVVAPLLRSREAYSGDTRAERVKRLEGIVRLETECGFGSDRFINLTNEGFDVLAHHAAQVGDYRSPDFDVLGAVAANTRNLRQILSSGKIGAMVLTSSVFAPGEGVGTVPLRAFSPYGLSKGMTNDLATCIAEQAGVRLGRFVIPNPFGPFEEPRFSAYLMKTWKAGNTARVNTPAYIRDNIHVDLLAGAYARYIAELHSGTAGAVLLPSGYVSSQGDFAERFAREMRSRLGLACGLDLATQTEFAEPIMRVNTEPASVYVPGWNETAAWDGVADAYR
ncbi:MAG: NAD(P)-dependent oxidoreductase [Hyphomicrobiales bacterium]